MAWARIASGVALLVAIYFGINPPSTFIAKTVAFAFGLAASSFFPTLLIGIFSKRIGTVAAMAGMIVGVMAISPPTTSTGSASSMPGSSARCRPPSLALADPLTRRRDSSNDAPMKLSAIVVESSERKAVVDVEVSVNGVLTAEGRVIAVKLPESMQAG